MRAPSPCHTRRLLLTMLPPTVPRSLSRPSAGTIPIFVASCWRKTWGGLSMNGPADQMRGRYLHFSENDFEYLPGWDANLTGKFEAFPKLGQLCPISPFRQPGELGDDAPAEVSVQGKAKVYLTPHNVLTTSMV